MSEGTYLEQYERSKRWLGKFEAINSGRIHDQNSDNYVDEIYAFFQNCYHVKDWLKNDVTIPTVTRQVVEAHVNSSRHLKLCADIANSLKHLKLTTPRSEENPKFAGKHFNLELGGSTSVISLKYEVDTDAGRLDAFTLANECVAEWKKFLAAQGLPY